VLDKCLLPKLSIADQQEVKTICSKTEHSLGIGTWFSPFRVHVLDAFFPPAVVCLQTREIEPRSRPRSANIQANADC
jgi:hypothetical protein